MTTRQPGVVTKVLRPAPTPRRGTIRLPPGEGRREPLWREGLPTAGDITGPSPAPHHGRVQHDHVRYSNAGCVHLHLGIGLRGSSRQGLRHDRRRDPRCTPGARSDQPRRLRGPLQAEPDRPRRRDHLARHGRSRRRRARGRPRDRLHRSRHPLRRRHRLRAATPHSSGARDRARRRSGRAGGGRSGDDVRLRHRRDARTDAPADPPRPPPLGRARRGPQARSAPLVASRRQDAGFGPLCCRSTGGCDDRPRFDPARIRDDRRSARGSAWPSPKGCRTTAC